MTKIFYLHTFITPNCDDTILKIIDRMGWDITSKTALGTVEGTVRVEVFVPDDDLDMFEMMFFDLL